MDAWRAANPHIVQLWADVEQAAIDAISTRQAIRLRNLVFSVESGILFIELPSGRRLAYVKPSWVRTGGAARPSPTAVSLPDENGAGWKPTAGNSSKTSSKPQPATSSSTP